MKKVTMIIILVLGITFSTVAAYSIINYILVAQVTEQVTVGDTIQEQNGVIVTELNKEQGNLTFISIPEDIDNKHQLTYSYSYQIIPNGYELQVSTTNTDIVIDNVSINEGVVDIIFSLNQENTYNSGEILDITFIFEAIPIVINGYSVENPLNVNSATADQLMGIGFTYGEAYDIEQSSKSFIDLSDVYGYFTLSNYELLLEYEAMGILVFE